MRKSIIFFAISILFSSPMYAQIESPVKPEREEKTVTMTQQKMVEIVQELVSETEGTANNLSFLHDGITITMVSDVAADRMRLVASVIDVEQLNEEQILATLVSNYHLALDARYAIGGTVLYATYIHPLSPLTKEQLLSGIRQVATLSKTFGSSYTSGEMTFGVQVEEDSVEI